VNRFHSSLEHRWKRAKRDGRMQFSFNWRGKFKTCSAARPYTQDDIRREEEAIARGENWCRRNSYYFD